MPFSICQRSSGPSGDRNSGGDICVRRKLHFKDSGATAQQGWIEWRTNSCAANGGDLATDLRSWRKSGRTRSVTRVPRRSRTRASGVRSRSRLPSMATKGAQRALQPAFVTLPDSDRTGRLGVMLMRAICAQAGVGCSETSPGEDHLAIDVKVEFPKGDVRVQIKSGTATPNVDGTLSVSVTDDWIAKWRRNHLPAYLVYVRLPHNDWGALLEHGDGTTLMYAQAYWARVDELSESPVRLRPENRLTMETFLEWEHHVDDKVRGGGAAA